MARKDKQFDAVGTMRSIRDRISREIDGMTFEEEQAYIYKHLGDEAVARFVRVHHIWDFSSSAALCLRRYSIRAGKSSA